MWAFLSRAAKGLWKALVRAAVWLREILPYVYLLRVPLLIWLAIFLLPILALPPHAALSSLARGLFDLSDPDTSQVGSYFFFTTLAVLLLGTSIAMTARLILLDSHERSDAPEVAKTRTLEGAIRGLPLLMVISVLIGILYQTGQAEPWRPMLIGGSLGIGAFLILFLIYRPLVWQVAVLGIDIDEITRLGRAQGCIMMLCVGTLPVLFLGELLARTSPPGFFEPGTRVLRHRHKQALLQLAFSLWVYGLVYLLGPLQATLVNLLLLAMLLCWFLAGLAFYLDRFRIPLLGVIAAYAFLMSLLPMSDSFYPSIEKRTSIAPPSPIRLLARYEGRPVVLVAAAGGGIQSAAWTARVLCGLYQDLRSTGFDRSIVFLSGVSGGSVGIMYVVDAFSGGHLPPFGVAATPQENLNTFGPVSASEASSLDSVTFGLAYPDFFWTFAPFLRGVSYRDGTWIDGHNLTNNRGTWLEQAWKRTDGLKTSTLSGWVADARDGLRPAVIFNGTIVETGERLLLGTTRLDDPEVNGGNAGRFGLRYFADLYPGTDLAVVTAARLSATFPYVSPAARIWRGGVFSNEYHVVDGGYFDNYGTATLMDWLDTGLQASSEHRPSKVLVIAIRSFPETAADPPSGQRGFWFQLKHPLETLNAVRHTAQLSRSETDFRFVLRQNAYPVPITVVPFEYSATGSDGKPVEEPLSWHLTPFDKKMLRQTWDSDSIRKSRSLVRAFFNSN